MIKKIIFCLFFATTYSISRNEKPIVLVVLSYHNPERTILRNLNSLQQDYKNYRIIYVIDGNDKEADNTTTVVEKWLSTHPSFQSRFKIIRNKKREGALYNQVQAVYLCNDYEIIGIVDGDDALAHKKVCKKINKLYSTYDVWLSYGQFMMIPEKKVGWCYPMSPYVIKNNKFRATEPFALAHFRTFYAWLLKQIPYEEFLYKGPLFPHEEFFPENGFYPMSGDVLTMMRMIEYAREHHACVKEILYLYNQANPISDHKRSKQSAEFQIYLNNHIRRLPPAKPFANLPFSDGLSKKPAREFKGYIDLPKT